MCSITSRCSITPSAGTAALCSYRQWSLKSAISRAWRVSRKAGAIHFGKVSGPQSQQRIAGIICNYLDIDNWSIVNQSPYPGGHSSLNHQTPPCHGQHSEKAAHCHTVKALNSEAPIVLTMLHQVQTGSALRTQGMETLVVRTSND